MSGLRENVLSQQDIFEFHHSLFYAITEKFLKHNAGERAHLASIYKLRHAQKDRENGIKEEVIEASSDAQHYYTMRKDDFAQLSLLAQRQLYSCTSLASMERR